MIVIKPHKGKYRVVDKFIFTEKVLSVHANVKTAERWLSIKKPGVKYKITGNNGSK